MPYAGNLNAVPGSTSCSTARPSFTLSIRCPTSRESPCGSRLHSVIGRCPYSRQCVNLIAAGKTHAVPRPTVDEPAVHCPEGIGIRDRADLSRGTEPSALRGHARPGSRGIRRLDHGRAPTCRSPSRHAGGAAPARPGCRPWSSHRAPRTTVDPTRSGPSARAGRSFGMMHPTANSPGTTHAGSGFPAHPGRACQCADWHGGEESVIGCGMAYAQKPRNGKVRITAPGPGRCARKICGRTAGPGFFRARNRCRQDATNQDGEYSREVSSPAAICLSMTGSPRT